MKSNHIIYMRARWVAVFSFVAGLIILSFILDRFPGYSFFKRREERRPAPASVSESAQKIKVEPVKNFPFAEDTALSEWEEKVFRGKVVYNIEKDQDLSYVRAKSEKAASALYYKMKMDAKKRRPVVSWKWRVEKFPVKQFEESLDKENEDDFAARVYVIFPAMFLTNSKVLEYVWAKDLPVGATGTSPYSKNIKLIVLRSGPAKDKEWSCEERDVVEDYIKMFGRNPEYDLGAVAFMTNTEHTGSSADAMYDEVTLGYKDGAMTERKGI